MKVHTINREIEAEQYLDDATNWHAFHTIIPAGDYTEVISSDEPRYLRITYDNRDYYLEFGDWVVLYPDRSLHFFSKAAFDELYTNPFTEPLSSEEIEHLLGAEA